METLNRSFPEDEPFRRKILADAGFDPELHARIRSIIGPAEIRAIIRAFRHKVSCYQPGVRPVGHERDADSHQLENVESCRFRANLHVHSRHSDGRLSVPAILHQAAAYADRVAEKLTTAAPAPFAPFTVGIMDHNRIDGCVEAIQKVFENPEPYRNLRIILGAEITVRINRIYQFQLKEKRHAHFLLTGITPQDPKLTDFLLPFAGAIPPTHRSFRGAPSVTLPQLARMLREQDFGNLAMAHPSRIQLKKFLCQPDFATEAMRQYVHLFRSILGRRALYVEAFYQAYTGNLAVDRLELKTILETAAAEHLLVAGGMDTHGGNIFFSKSSQKFPLS